MLLHVHKHTVAHHFSFRSKFLIRWARTKQYELYISGITLKSHTTLSGKKDSSVNVLFLPEEYLKGCWEWLEVIIGVNLSPHTTTIVILNADLAKHLQKTTASNHIHLKLSPRTTVPGPQQQCEWKTYSTHFFFLNSKHLCQETHKEKTANPLGNMFFHKSSSPQLTYLHNKVIWYYHRKEFQSWGFERQSIVREALQALALCQKRQLWKSLRWPTNNLPCYTLSPTQYHSFFRNLPRFNIPACRWPHRWRTEDQ